MGVSVAVAVGGGCVGVEDGAKVRVAVGSVVAVGAAVGGGKVLVAGTAVTADIWGAGSGVGAEQAATSKKNSSQWIDFPRNFFGFIMISMFIEYYQRFLRN